MCGKNYEHSCKMLNVKKNFMYSVFGLLNKKVQIQSFFSKAFSPWIRNFKKACDMLLHGYEPINGFSFQWDVNVRWHRGQILVVIQQNGKDQRIYHFDHLKCFDLWRSGNGYKKCLYPLFTCIGTSLDFIFRVSIKKVIKMHIQHLHKC